MIKSINISKLGLSLFIGIIACLLSSCDNEVDIQQAYPFTRKSCAGKPPKYAARSAARDATTRRGTRSAIFSQTAKVRSAWTTARCSCPTTAIRSTARCSASTIPPHRPISRPSTFTSRTISGDACSLRSTSTMKTKKRRSVRI